MTINISGKKLALLAVGIVAACVIVVFAIMGISKSISNLILTNSVKSDAISYLKNYEIDGQDINSVDDKTIKVTQNPNYIYGVSGEDGKDDVNWAMVLRIDPGDYSKYTYIMGKAGGLTAKGQKDAEAEYTKEVEKETGLTSSEANKLMKQYGIQWGSQETFSSSTSASSSPSSVSSQQPSGGSPYTSPPILGSATTPLTRGLDSGYTTAQNITAQGIVFIGGIRKNTDGTSTIDLWVVNNTKSDVLGGFTVKIDTNYLGGGNGDFYISGNDAVATSTQSLNATYQENVQIHVNTTSNFDNVPIRIYTKKSTTELATMTLKLQS